MLIGYSMPAVTGLALAGAAWLTADEGAACTDGKPARRARVNGTPVFTLTFGAAFVPRVIAVLGLVGVAAGSTITATTGASGALGGNSATAAAVQFADGSIGAWIVTGGTVSTATVKIAIGATGVIDIGELVAMPAVEIDIESNWTDEPVDPSLSNLSLAAQPSTVRRQAYRRLECLMTPDGVAKARAGGLANGMDWSRLRVAMFADGRVVGIPRWLTPAGAIDTAELHQTAIYGTARMGGTGHLGGDYYGASLAFQEVPSLA